MANELHRGEIWMYTFAAPDKRRPVLVLSSDLLLRLKLHQVTVAEITSALRGSQAEVTIGTEAGLKHPSSVNLINVQTVPRAHLAHYVGAVSPEAMHRVCEALRVATGC